MMTLLQENYSNLNLRIAITAMGLSLAFVPSISTANDKSIIVPVFELYHTDNLNGGTTSAQFNNNGTLVSTPLNMKPKSGTARRIALAMASATTLQAPANAVQTIQEKHATTKHAL